MTTEVLRDVYLWGSLGEKFGHHHRLVVRTPAEALRAIECNRPGFLAYIYKLHEEGLVFACTKGDTALTDADLFHPLGSDSFDIAPVVHGAGQNAGVWEIIIGVVLIIAAVLLGPPGWVVAGVGWGVMEGSYAFAVAAFGAALAFQGLAQLLTPTPKFDSNADETAKTRASAFFGGAVNTTAQGQPVPVLYGRGYVGSATISLGLSNIDRTAEEAANAG